MENKIIVITADELSKLITKAVSDAIKESQETRELIINDPNHEKLLTIKTITQELGVSRTTINQWIKKGLIQYTRIGTRLFFKRSEILKPKRKESKQRKVPAVDGFIKPEEAHPCEICGGEIKTKYYRYCESCRESNKKEIDKRGFAAKAEELSDAYVAQRIRNPIKANGKLPIKEIPKELIELKRESIKLNRQIKKQQL